MQVVGRPFDEPTVLRIGAAYEAATRFFEARPGVELKVAV
jgi:aspartyl-tRNA(Asn)/glutamyl-tRNA(Gln) amidotransferase subunit A